MSTLKANKFQHISATGTNTNIEFDDSRNVTCKNDLTVDGGLTTGDGLTVKGTEGSHGSIQLWADEGDDNADKWKFLAHTGGDFQLQNYSTGSWQNSIGATGNGGIVLNHAGDTKLATGSSGVTITGYINMADDSTSTGGDIYIPDAGVLNIGTGNDLKIYHTADGDNYIYGGAQSLRIQVAGGENSITCVNEAQVELYYNHLLRFYTENTGNCARLDTYGTNAFKLRNLDTTAGGAHTNQIYFNFNRTGGGMDNPGAKIVAGKEQEWQGAAANQDGYLAFETMNDESINEKFRIAANGDLTATDTSIASNSDSRLKTNIADYTYDLTKFKQLQPKTFDWRNPAMHGNKSGVRGFVAQDLEAVDSYWVSSEKIVSTYGTTADDAVANPDLSLLDADGIAKTSKLGQKDAMYISVINQLVAKIETLETKVAALEAA